MRQRGHSKSRGYNFFYGKGNGVSIYVSTTILLIHNATCFNPSVGHLQAYIAD